MNLLAVIALIFMNPQRPLKALSVSALRTRLLLFLLLIVLVVSALVYTKFLLPKEKDNPKEHPAAEVRLHHGAMVWRATA